MPLGQLSSYYEQWSLTGNEALLAQLRKKLAVASFKKENIIKFYGGAMDNKIDLLKENI